MSARLEYYMLDEPSLLSLYHKESSQPSFVSPIFVDIAFMAGLCDVDIISKHSGYSCVSLAIQVAKFDMSGGRQAPDVSRTDVSGSPSVETIAVAALEVCASWLVDLAAVFSNVFLLRLPFGLPSLLM
jgi:hypothetical protein